MNLLFTVLDGAAGRPHPKLKGKTPLKAANTPTLDKLAENSQIGQMTVVPEIAPESDSAVIALLGYDPEKVYTGRGPLEALGAGMKFQKGNLALRCNFATLKDDEILDRRVARSLTEKEAQQLQETINKEVKLTDANFTFKSTLAHRGALVIESKEKLEPHITNTDPAYSKEGLVSVAKETYEPKLMKCKPLRKGSEKSAQLVNEFTQKTTEALKETEINKERRKKGMLEANAVLTRDAGTEKPGLRDINELYGAEWTILANMPLEIGIAKAAGMKIKKINEEQNYDEWVEKTIQAMKETKCLYIHLKGPDLPGHDGKPIEKKQKIEEIDREYYQKLLSKIDSSKTIIVVTCDHATPCILKAHSSDPVPFMISHSNMGKNTAKFNEDDAEKSKIKLEKGHELMPHIKKIHQELEGN